MNQSQSPETGILRMTTGTARPSQWNSTHLELVISIRPGPLKLVQVCASLSSSSLLKLGSYKLKPTRTCRRKLSGLSFVCLHEVIGQQWPSVRLLILVLHTKVAEWSWPLNCSEAPDRSLQAQKISTCVNIELRFLIQGKEKLYNFAVVKVLYHFRFQQNLLDSWRAHQKYSTLWE